MGVAPGGKRAYRLRGKRSPAGGMCLTKRDREILRDVFLQRAITRKQLMRLGHFTSLTSASERLRILFDHGFLERYPLATDLSTTELVYSVGFRAIPEIVSGLGVDKVEVKRCVSSGAPLALAHAVAVTDARIALTKHQPPEMSLEWLSEVQVRHEFSIGTSRFVLKPDGALIIEQSGRKHIAFLEVDRGNVSKPQFRRSCQTYKTYIELGLPEEVYGARSASLLIIAHAGERRRTNLLEIAGTAGVPTATASWFEIDCAGPHNSVWTTYAEPEVRKQFSEVIRCSSV